MHGAASSDSIPRAQVGNWDPLYGSFVPEGPAVARVANDYVADVVLGEATQWRSAFAQDAFGTNIVEATSQIAAAIREISATSGELLQTIASVDAGARKSAESAVNGRVRLDAVASTMTHLDGATKDIADRLQVIAEKAADLILADA